MPQKELPGVKHIELPCMEISIDPNNPCKAAAFIQVVVVDDPKLQQKIDARATQKLREALAKAHQNGEHDD